MAALSYFVVYGLFGGAGSDNHADELLTLMVYGISRLEQTVICARFSGLRITQALREYRGSIVLISHDEVLVEEISVNRVLELK